MLQHKDYVKAAKEFNMLTGMSIKVVAVKGDALKKDIIQTVKKTTGFDYFQLSDATLDVFDDLGCTFDDTATDTATETSEKTETKTEAPKKKEKVIQMKTKKTEKTQDQLGPAMINVAVDLIDVLGYDKKQIDKFKEMSLKQMLVEIQKMADVINEPYEEDGKTVTPTDTPDMFKAETLAFFIANDIKVKWNEPEVISEVIGEEIQEDFVETGVEEAPEMKPKSKSKKKDDKPAAVKKENDTPVKKTEPKEAKYTRINAFCDVIKEKKALTKSEINDKMNEAYGGDPRDQAGNINFMLTPLIEFELIEVKGEGKETTYKLK